MKKWPLNSTILFAATHNKLRKAVDGTGTPIAICMINKWMAKINEKEIYNGKCPPGRGERKSKRKKKEDGCSSYHPWKLLPLSTKELRRRRISLRTKLEDKLLPFLHTFDHPISLWSCLAVGALTKAQFLSQFSLPNLLYRARWVWAHLRNSNEPPKSGPYKNQHQNFYKNKNVHRIQLYNIIFHWLEIQFRIKHCKILHLLRFYLLSLSLVVQSSQILYFSVSSIFYQEWLLDTTCIALLGLGIHKSWIFFEQSTIMSNTFCKRTYIL